MSDIDIFISYSHKDEPLKNELLKHLANLKRQGVIRHWHDRRIYAGNEWSNQIDDQLNKADIILLLVSPDFMASDYCHDIEVKQALKRHKDREASVIPIIIRPVDWQGAVFNKLQALPKDAIPVTKWPDRDEAFLDVIEGIRAAIKEREISCLMSQFLRVGYENVDEKVKTGERILTLDPNFQITKGLSMRTRLASLYCERGNTKANSIRPKPISEIIGRTIEKDRKFDELTNENRQKIYERALRDFERAIELCPNNPDAYYCRGNLRSILLSRLISSQEVFDYNRALDDYTHAIELAPDNGAYYYARAILNNPKIGLPHFLQDEGVSQKRQMEAEQDFQQAIRLGYLDPETRLPILPNYIKI